MDHDEIERALENYAECALWTASCNGQADHEDCRGQDCDASLLDLGYDLASFDPASVAEMRAQLSAFVASAEAERPDAFAGMDPEQLGHDFSLTRNGHGAGFWDRGLGERGTYLTALCKPYGEAHVYVGDDGIAHHNG